MLRDFTPRLYQETIFARAIKQNTMVVLPTGLGKTAVAAMVAAYRLKQYPEKKVLFLAPTRPLVQQHIVSFKKMFDLQDDDFALFTGYVKPEKRALLFKSAKIIFSTPQGLENDVISNRIDLKDVSLLVFDEAHRTTGDYAYVYLAKKYHEVALHERILALSASPGSDEESIREVCNTLYVEGLEVKGYDDEDVKKYTQEVEVKWEKVKLSEELLKIKKFLDDCYASKLLKAFELGVIGGKVENFTKSSLLSLQGALHAKMMQGEKNFEVLKTISLIAEALKVQHALELCETQTVSALNAYMQKLQSQAMSSKVKAVKNLVKDVNFVSAYALSNRLIAKGIEHPKLWALLDVVAKHDDTKLIIFTQYRDTAKVIQSALGVKSEVFVGQQKKGGMGLSQKKQKEMLDRFRSDEFRVLIATSVAEEGLDIPSVDAVIFYEPIPSAIRTVQRRGRTGRHDKGHVYVLMAENTRDEGYRWAAHHKEKRMYRTLKKLQKSYNLSVPAQSSLKEYASESGICIGVDYREKGSAVMKQLLQKNVRLDLKRLEVGDYQVSDDVVVEFKTVKDFVDSIVDGRLLGQLSDLRMKFKPILIIEGNQDLYAQRNINPASIQGMLATIALSYQIPIIRTMSSIETAGILVSLAKREVRSDERAYSLHTDKPWNLKLQQEYIVGALPGIGPKLAKELLSKFGSVGEVFSATVDKLKEIPLIGEKKALAVRDAIEKKYDV